MAARRRRRKFKVREYVVYPSHGVGRITGVEKREIAGNELELFVIFVKSEKLTLRVPTNKAFETGMRRLSTPQQIESALEILKGRPQIKRAMWSRRAQEYDQKINSGSLTYLAEVVRDLHRSDDKREQSYSERQLYESAVSRFSREIAAVNKINETAAIDKIMKALAKRKKS